MGSLLFIPCHNHDQDKIQIFVRVKPVLDRITGLTGNFFHPNELLQARPDATGKIKGVVTVIFRSGSHRTQSLLIKSGPGLWFMVLINWI